MTLLTNARGIDPGTVLMGGQWLIRHPVTADMYLRAAGMDLLAERGAKAVGVMV